ncbi:MAG: hypothetical protein U0946_02040 [Patescibacteria group bacterium]|nr:hypothetical protein [Patescibacteria group bacterium]
MWEMEGRVSSRKDLHKESEANPAGGGVSGAHQSAFSWVVCRLSGY